MTKIIYQAQAFDGKFRPLEELFPVNLKYWLIIIYHDESNILFDKNINSSPFIIKKRESQFL